MSNDKVGEALEAVSNQGDNEARYGYGIVTLETLDMVRAAITKSECWPFGQNWTPVPDATFKYPGHEQDYVEIKDDLGSCVFSHAKDVFWKHVKSYRIFTRHFPNVAAPKPAEQEGFQQRVQPWMMACFGPEISADRTERNHRFLEEALELVQSLGCTQSEAHQLVDYVFSRPVGEPKQESGGVMVTHAALCLAAGLDMHESGEVELARISQPEIMDKIRAKQAAKPKHSPLPEAYDIPHFLRKGAD